MDGSRRIRSVSCCRSSRIFVTATCCASSRCKLSASTLTRSSGLARRCIACIWCTGPALSGCCATPAEASKAAHKTGPAIHDAPRTRTLHIARVVLLKLSKPRVLHPGVHNDLLNFDLLRLLHSLHLRLGYIGHHYPTHRLVFTVINLDGVVLAIQPPGRAFDLALEKGFCVHPYVLALSVLEGQFQAIIVLALNILRALQFRLRPFRRVVHQRPVQIRLECCCFQFICSKRFYFMPVQERTKLPPMCPVVGLNGGLPTKIDFQTQLARTFRLQTKG